MEERQSQIRIGKGGEIVDQHFPDDSREIVLMLNMDPRCREMVSGDEEGTPRLGKRRTNGLAC